MITSTLAHSENEPTTEETLFSLRKHLKEMEEVYTKFPFLRDREMQDTVHLAEEFQRKYDEESGFSKQQMSSHSLVVKIPTPDSEKGKVSASVLSRLLGKFLEVIDNLDDGSNSANLKTVFAGIGTGSAILLVDFEQNSKATDSTIFEERIQRSLSSAKYLYSEKKSEVEMRASEFKESVKTDSEVAYKLAATIQAMTPTAYDQVEEITISLPKSDFSITLKQEDRVKMSKVKAYLEKHRKEDDGTTIVFRGELGEPSGWSIQSKHRFKIAPDNGDRTVTIHHTNSIDDQVKANYQKSVSVRAEFRKGKWQFVEWL